jgi:hypothetical protein
LVLGALVGTSGARWNNGARFCFFTITSTGGGGGGGAGGNKLVEAGRFWRRWRLTHKPEALATHRQQAHHKVALVVQAVLSAANMVLVAAAAHLLLGLMAQLRSAAMVALVRHQALLVLA